MIINLVNILAQKISKVNLNLSEGKIQSIDLLGSEDPNYSYALPGFVDAHVHIESSMLTPSQFARLAVVHGTVATVSDPHEIANVLGQKGVDFMLEDAKLSPFKFCFGAPSCVPATTFETAGASLDAEDIGRLLEKREVGYLAEVMNFPGVLNKDPDLMAKIAWAKYYNKPVDGHAPGLRGTSAKQYASEGITTDHECFTYDEAREKIEYGVKILIREGSAARNFDALSPLISEFPDQIMFCSDDKHPDNLVEGHINKLVLRALKNGHNLWNVLKVACINPVWHYGLPVGLLNNNDPADFIVVNNLKEFNVLQTWLNGEVVAENEVSLLPDRRSLHPNQFNCNPLNPTDFEVEAVTSRVRVIEALEGQLVTNQLSAQLPIKNGYLLADPANDILKIAVVNRYSPSKPAIAFIKNFGLKAGAIASSVAHDSHNIIIVGSDDESMCKAANLIIASKGGISAVSAAENHFLPLPIAGIMTDADGYAVAELYTGIDQFVKNTLRSTLHSPFMTLSFMALLVIPSLKLSDKGLFNGDRFEFVSLFID